MLVTKSFGYGQKVIATVQNVFRVAVEKKLKKVYSTLTATVKPRKEVSALCGFKINAATRLHDATYSRFISGLNKAGIELDRKVLADIALKEPANFAKLVEAAQNTLSK